MKRAYMKNIVFTSVMLLTCLIRLVFKVFFPDILFPFISIPLMVLLASISQIISYYLGFEDDGCPYVGAVLGGLSFSLLPVAAGVEGSKSFLVLLISGVLVYGLVDLLYSSMKERMESGRTHVLAPVVNGLMLFFAFQAFMGLI